MNPWRWLGLSIFLFGVCLLGTSKFSVFAQGDDAKVAVSADPDKATVKPGESKTVEIKLKRGAKADKDVTLTAEIDAKDKDKGVSVKLAADKVTAKDKDTKLTIETKDTTAEGDYKITVKSKTEGSESSATFTLTVKKETVVKKETPPVAGAWKFKAFDTKEKKFYVVQTTKTTQDIKVMGQNVQQIQEQTFLIEWNPVDNATDYVVKQKILGVKMQINIGGNKISYDSTAANKQKNPMTDFFEALTKQELKFTIEKDLSKVKSIDGRDTFVKNLSDINPQMKTLLEKILSDKSLSAMAEPSWYAFPPGGDGSKKEWTRNSTLDLGPIGKYSTDFTYKPKEPKGTKETISIGTKLTYTAPSDKAGLPFIIHDAKLSSADGSGETVFDTAAGRFESTKLKMKLTGNLQIEVGGMRTTVELSQEQDSTSNTYDKEGLPAEWKDAVK